MSDFGPAGCPDTAFWATKSSLVANRLLIARLSAGVPRNSEQLRDRERLGLALEAEWMKL